VAIKKVLILGDSPRLNTGFGRVNRLAAQLFQKQGWEVATVAGLTKQPPSDESDGIKTYVPKMANDVLGLYDIAPAVEDFKPDIVYLTADPGSAVSLASACPSTVPGVGYIPIEGGPINNHNWQMLLSGLPMLTCSQYGAELIKSQLGRDVDYAYHAIDPDVFRINGKRDEIRQSQHWEDKFVIICVANNVRRKQIPRLIEAVSILKHQYGRKDIILYLHTVPFQNYWLEGWNLTEIVEAYDVVEEVKFHPAMMSYQSSVPEVSNIKGYPGLVDMYNAADVFVLPSQVEGFGLPILEAMACGLPVLVTKYAAGWEVARGAGMGIPINDWEIHKSGTRYANIDVEELAKMLLKLSRNPKELKRMSEASLERAKAFSWDDFTSKLIPLMEETYRGYQEQRRKNEGTDTGAQATGEGLDILEDAGEDGSTQGERIIKGKG
jgi:glycosyltransferase involved in cell wall biosynthesis